MKNNYVRTSINKIDRHFSISIKNIVKSIYLYIIKMLPLTSLFIPNVQVMTKLEKIVASRAIGNSIVSHLSSEISFEKILFEVSNINSPNLWIFSATAVILYGQYKFYEGSKLRNIEVYNKYNKMIRELLVIIFLVFTKDVQNAI